ncbi:MAG: polysaccharide biosynthesis tyrosine autokinase [Planctomycetota bacterium]|jgi:capsular exopolysaccharide synthesis family protein
MDGLEKYQYGPLQQEVVQFDGPVDDQNDSAMGLVSGLLRRWPVVLATCIVVCAIGVPAIWFLVEKKYDTEGAIRISPTTSPILFDTKERLPNYQVFMNTQAELIRSNTVLNDVADALKDSNLDMFKDVPDIVAVLRKSVVSGAIIVEPVRSTELMRIRMSTKNLEQAERIVDAFIRAYMARVVRDEIRGEDQKLSTLSEERRILSEKIQRQQDTIRQLGDEYGSTVLTSRQEIMLQQVASLQSELVNINIRRISLETQIQVQESGAGELAIPDTLVERRNVVINSDHIIQALTSNILQYEQFIVVGQQTMTPENPELKQRKEVLKTLEERLAQRQEEVAEEFDKNFEAQLAKNKDRRLAELKINLEQTIRYEEKIREKLEKQDVNTIGIGRKQFAIDDQKEQLARTKAMYDRVNKRIDQIELERKRPARISIAYGASSIPAQGKRRKMAVAVGFGGIALGLLLALLLDKADKSLHSPKDVVRRVGVRIIGTTTSPKSVDKLLLGRQLEDDYQTIRANLGLLDSEDTSKILVVTSPGVGDGKTTFAVNLATSFAHSGEKVLLIDGDIRKSDIAEILNLPKGSKGLQDMLIGKEFEKLVYHTGTAELDVLAADRRNASDAIDLLAKTHNSEYIAKISTDYDHVIIDTPPVLAFSDALLWARMADGVILTSFVDRTSRVDLKEAISRLERTDAKILGTVLNNVKVAHSYHRYGYGYGHTTSADEKQQTSSRSKPETLLLRTKPKDQPDGKRHS